MKHVILVLIIGFSFFSCKQSGTGNSNSFVQKCSYLDYSNKDDIKNGGVKMIPIKTPSGTFRVWTKRIGNNPDIKVLLLHGGPGVTHEYYEIFDSYFPNAQIEYYYYDQLGSAYSDKSNDSTLWTIAHYVDEVEQVRKALNLNSDNFYLFGNSWGGLLAMEYALKYQKNLKGLIISNMMASIPDYNDYATNVLGPQLPPDVFKEIKALEKAKDFDNPRYMELIHNYYETEHLLRMPPDKWPEPVVRSFNHTNINIYRYMQGPSEFGCVGDATLVNWDIKDKLSQISVPTLIIGAKYDTMDPEHMKWMASEVQNGTFLYCPNGSHLAMYDDSDIYFKGLIKFIYDVNKLQ